MDFNRQYKNKLRSNLEIKFCGDKDKIIDHLIDMYLEEVRLKNNLERQVHEPVKTESYSFERFKRAVEKYKDIMSKKETTNVQ